MSTSGLCTSVWGSPGWLFLHSIAAGYPVNPDEYDAQEGNPLGHTRKVYTDFFTNTGGVLPCRFCRDSYKLFIKEIPISDYIHSRESIFEWLFIIHNKVNKKLGIKEEDDLSRVVSKYESFRAKCSKDSNAKGCTIPSGDNVKMKCRLVIEPMDAKKHVAKCVVGSVLVVLVLLIVSKKIRSSR